MKKAGLAVAMFLFAAFQVVAQVNGVTAELKLDQEEYLPGEDLQLKLRISNRSGQEITLGTDNNWIRMSVVDDNGLACQRLGEMPVQGEFSLLSGEAGTKALNPTPYFSYRKLGRYRVVATIRIPQWQQDVICKPIWFTVGNGVELHNLANLQFGVPPAGGATNASPEIRKYSLLKVSFLKEIKLYFRLVDVNGKIIKVFPIAPMTTFSEPEAQLDRFNNLHVLSQFGAHDFVYCEFNPDGHWMLRQTYQYTDSRPVLRMDSEGKIYVGGGMRRASANDYPGAADSAPQTSDSK